MNFQKKSINIDLWLTEDETFPKNTPMREFYRGKTVFLTGGTGFLGQIFVEKLLRCEVKALYLLTRAKKGKSSEERMRDIFSGDLFEPLMKQDPNYMERIRIMEGNTRELDVGLSPKDKQDIIDNADIVLHAAADVRFDNTLKELCLVNLRGTREMLRIAEQIQNLEVFAYISTAYSHCDKLHIEEKFYNSPIDPEEMIRLAEAYDGSPDENLFEVLTEVFVSPWPNTYSYTKALSEELMRIYGQKLPIVVMRPSIIISTHEDPIPGWCNNIYGLNGMLVACALGFLRIMVFDPRNKGEIVCADFVTNSTLAAIWDKHANKPAAIQAGEEPVTETKIFHIISNEDDVTWGQISEDMRQALLKYPSMQCIWVHLPSTTRCRFMEFFYVIFYHAIPGLLFDIYLHFTNNPRRLLPLYRKCHLFMCKLRYFMTQEWTFERKNMNEIYDKMNKHDQKYFPSDVRKCRWSEYSFNYHFGLLKYVGQDSFENFPAARRKLMRFRIAHFFVLVFYYSFFATFYYFLGHLLGFNDYIRNLFGSYLS